MYSKEYQKQLEDEINVLKDQKSVLDKIEKIKEKMNKSRQNEFEETYKKYQEAVEFNSGGLVQTNKAEFIKMVAFFDAIIYPKLSEWIKELIK
jgi:hypothetical protein